MLPSDQRHALLARLIDKVNDAGWLIIADERKNMSTFKTISDNSPKTWNITKDDKGLLLPKFKVKLINE